MISAKREIEYAAQFIAVKFTFFLSLVIHQGIYGSAFKAGIPTSVAVSTFPNNIIK